MILHPPGIRGILSNAGATLPYTDWLTGYHDERTMETLEQKKRSFLRSDKTASLKDKVRYVEKVAGLDYFEQERQELPEATLDRLLVNLEKDNVFSTFSEENKQKLRAYAQDYIPFAIKGRELEHRLMVESEGCGVIPIVGGLIGLGSTLLLTIYAATETYEKTQSAAWTALAAVGTLGAGALASIRFMADYGWDIACRGQEGYVQARKEEKSLAGEYKEIRRKHGV